MTTDITVRKETGLAMREEAMQELETRFAMAVRQRELLENYIKIRLKPDKHFYTVKEGQEKPSLKKEGAELINLPHNYKPKYEIVSGPSSPTSDNAPYQLTVKAALWNQDKFGGEGIGSASSYQTTKDGKYQPRQKDPGLCFNATLKMAQKSAYIAATLNSTAASEFFTQDLEDYQAGELKQATEDKSQHWCKEHNTAYFMRGKMKSFAHPIGDTGQWCHEHKDKAAPKAESNPAPTQTDTTAEEDWDNMNREETHEPAAAPARDPATIKNTGELVKACSQDWNMKLADVCKELNINSMTQLAESPADAYRRIAAVKN